MSSAISFNTFIDTIADISSMTVYDAILITGAFNKSARFICIEFVMNHKPSFPVSDNESLFKIYITAGNNSFATYVINEKYATYAIIERISKTLDEFQSVKPIITLSSEILHRYNLNPEVRKTSTLVIRLNEADSTIYDRYLYNADDGSMTQLDIDTEPRVNISDIDTKDIAYILQCLSDGSGLSDECINGRHITNRSITPAKLDKQYAELSEILNARKSATETFSSLHDRLLSIDTKIADVATMQTELDGIRNTINTISADMLILNAKIDEIVRRLNSISDSTM